MEVPKKKAITNKTGGLSFINKLDLLYDIEIFDDKEYITILLLMQYRNQFMHNYECNTFIDAFEFLGSDKRNRLLLYAENKLGEKNEEKIKDAFNKLYIEILKILRTKADLKKNIIAENKDYFDSLNNKVILLYDKYLELSDLIFDYLEPNLDDSKIITDYKIAFFNSIKRKVEENIKSIDFKKNGSEKYEEYKIKLIGRLLNKR